MAEPVISVHVLKFVSQVGTHAEWESHKTVPESLSTVKNGADCVRYLLSVLLSATSGSLYRNRVIVAELIG